MSLLEILLCSGSPTQTYKLLLSTSKPLCVGYIVRGGAYGRLLTSLARDVMSFDCVVISDSKSRENEIFLVLTRYTSSATSSVSLAPALPSIFPLVMPAVF